MSAAKKVFLILISVLLTEISSGQQMPFNPFSYRIFSPFVINPAVAGSKDFFSTDVLAAFTGEAYSQMVSSNGRLLKKEPAYSLSAPTYKFTRIGIGGSLFNDTYDLIQTAGASLAVSYHHPLNKNSLSFISAGASVKGIYHHYDGTVDLSIPEKEFVFPEVDLGIYFYNPSGFAGISATNILARPEDTDGEISYKVPVSRLYNFIAGYKFVISRQLKIVAEPSLTITTDDSLSFDIRENIEPALRMYFSNFCIGTYFNDYSKISFFFQYKYPKFYVGTFFALPKDSPFFKKSLTAEVAFGLNFSHKKAGYTEYGHW